MFQLASVPKPRRRTSSLRGRHVVATLDPVVVAPDVVMATPDLAERRQSET